jgi:hypothetical protein
MNYLRNTLHADGLGLAGNDSGFPTEPYALSPFGERSEAVAPASPAEVEVAVETLNHKALFRTRKSPAAALLDGSAWTLKAYQLDMDAPKTLLAYIDEQLKRLLSEQGLIGLEPAELFIDFVTDNKPGISVEGGEHYHLRLSVKTLARITRDPAAFIGLVRTMETDRAVHPLVPSFTLKRLVRLILQANWADNYRALLNDFWATHQRTFCLLAKLSFLDGLCHLRSQRTVSLEGYALGLDALGLAHFPHNLDALEPSAVGRRSIVQLVTLEGQVIPGIFQLRSKTTHHCYLHTLGEQAACSEYISDDEPWCEKRVLDALNRSEWHRQHLDIGHETDEVPRLAMIECRSDLFIALAEAQRSFSSQRVDSDSGSDSYLDDPDEDDVLFMPVHRALKLVSTLDLWGEQADIRCRVPDPMKIANRLMRHYMKRDHGLSVDPKQVFIRYLPGTATTPLGHARAPVTRVVAPDESPLSLGKALINNYRVKYPIGYLDHGGRTAVYLDPTREGRWAAANELPVTAEALEQHIRQADFLAVMSQRLERFWERQRETVERSLRRTFMAQAIVALKCEKLSRAGFDLLVAVLEESTQPDTERTTHWSALGFHVQRSFVPGSDCGCCVGLMLFRHATKPGLVLYQAGQQQPFVECLNHKALGAHLRLAAADERWRKTLLKYVPVTLHSRLDYILRLWAEVRSAPRPTSDLRPWTDAYYQEDVHKAKGAIHCEHAVDQSPFAFMRQTLRHNTLSDVQNSITTAREVWLQEWTERLNALQWIIAPLSILLAPAALASLAAAAGSLYLNIQAVALPGNREREKQQLLLAAMSLGLLQMGAVTPRLLIALRRFVSAQRSTALSAPVITRGVSALLRRSMETRKTQLERFFESDSLLKTWTLPASPALAFLAVKAWKLERNFLLWTSTQSQARTLIVSTHGYYLPWSKTAAIPNGTELRTYAPHGFELVDPGLHRVVSQRVQAFSLLQGGHNTPGPAFSQLPGWQLTDKALAGTSRPGRIKNYTLGKFQSERYESYRDIGNVVRHSHQSPFFGQLMPTPMDVLTVRNRFGHRNPSLQELFAALSKQGIHYDHILLLHCRCSAVNSLMGRSPAFHAAAGGAPITP